MIRSNKDALRFVFRMYDMCGKHFNGIKSMYLNSQACVGVKEDESKGFRIYSGVRQGYIPSPWLLNVYMNGGMKEVNMGMGRMGVTFLVDRRKWKFLASCIQMA